MRYVKGQKLWYWKKSWQVPRDPEEVTVVRSLPTGDFEILSVDVVCENGWEFVAGTRDLYTNYDEIKFLLTVTDI